MLDGEQVDAKSAGSATSAVAPAKCATRKQTPPACEPPRPKILVISDRAADYALIEPCLNYMTKYEPLITLAGNFAAARFALASDEFDAVLLDCDAPEVLGPDFRTELAAAAIACPLVLVTGEFGASNRQTAVERGAAVCIRKSDLTPKLLEAILHSALHGQSPR